jgi:hypothetical protein
MRAGVIIETEGRGRKEPSAKSINHEDLRR